MALFSKRTEPEQPASSTVAPSAKKATPTPTRREAEAARRQRMNPSLSPREARRREREVNAMQRQASFARQEQQPSRELMRDHVDSRFNPAEVALPALLTFMVLTMIPALRDQQNVLLYLTWGFIAFLLLDAYLMWRKFKQLAAQRLPGTPLRGLMMYGINRQMTFRRWRQPAPRIKRGEKF